MDDLQKMKTLAALIESGALDKGWPTDFSESVAKQFNDKGKLSDKQWFYVDRILDQVTAKNDVPETFNAKAIYDLFFQAREHIKFPKFTLPFEADDEEHTVRVKMTGDKSKTPDTVTFEIDGNWAGYIYPDGRIDIRKPAPAGMWELMNQFAADPQGVASERGKHTGNCVFCSKPLNDPRSVAAGYGKKCASNYGMEW